MTAQSWAVFLGAFLLGALPTAAIVARAVAGVDIRTVGDGNAGARNTFCSIGPAAGVLVGLVDVGKGAMAVVLAQRLGEPAWVVRVSGACAVLGHDYSPFLRGRGGQGMAAILGILGMLYPWETAMGLLVAALMLALSRNWDLAWFAAFGLFALSLWFTGYTTAEALYPVWLLPTIGVRKLQQTWQAHKRLA